MKVSKWVLLVQDEETGVPCFVAAAQGQKVLFWTSDKEKAQRFSKEAAEQLAFYMTEEDEECVGLLPVRTNETEEVAFAL
jgi:hypothetical protein